METIISQIQSDLADLQNNPNGLTYEQLVLFYDRMCANVTDFESQDKKSKTISISWSTQDVLMLADEMDVQLTEAQADEVLDRLVENHDGDIGINWGVIEYFIDEIISEQWQEK